MAQLKAGSTVGGKVILNVDDLNPNIVIGPGSAIDGDIVQFDTTSGKLVKGGIKFGVAANNAVQLTSAGKLPAVDGSLVTGMVPGLGAVIGSCLPDVVAPPVAAGTIIGSAATQRTTNSLTYVLLKEIIIKRAGTCLVTWNVLEGALAKTKVYIDDIPYGTEKTGQGIFVETPVTINYNTKIQIYARTTNSYYAVKIQDMLAYANPWAAYEGVETTGL